jgi:hypothetical protein
MAVLLWIVTRKAYPILAGFLFATAAGSAVTYSFDPAAWSQYVHMMKTENMLHEFIATLSCAMRFVVDRNAIWIQFVPCAVACCWTAWYFWKWRKQWNWMEHGMLALLVSAMCTPYGWFFDESVLLPAMIVALLKSKESGRPIWPIMLAGGAALAEMQFTPSVASGAYLWTTPAWLACYLLATRTKSAAQHDTPLAAPAGLH